MSDVSKYLPLSQRGSEDESKVTGDWSAHLAATLNELATLLEPLPTGVLDAATPRPGFDVRTTVGHTLWHLGRSRLERGQDLLRVMVGSRMPRAAALRQLSRSASPDTTAASATALRSRANALSSGKHRSGVGDLSVAVVNAYVIAAALETALEAAGSDRAGSETAGSGMPASGMPASGMPGSGIPGSEMPRGASPLHSLRIDPIASGAVALARSLSAPVELRAVVSERALRASDAAWTVGRGRELSGNARELVLFLWGYAGLPGQGGAPTATKSDS
jgi:hypothetical protein